MEIPSWQIWIGRYWEDADHDKIPKFHQIFGCDEVFICFLFPTAILLGFNLWDWPWCNISRRKLGTLEPVGSLWNRWSHWSGPWFWSPVCHHFVSHYPFILVSHPLWSQNLFSSCFRLVPSIPSYDPLSPKYSCVPASCLPWSLGLVSSFCLSSFCVPFIPSPIIPASPAASSSWAQSLQAERPVKRLKPGYAPGSPSFCLQSSLQFSRQSAKASPPPCVFPIMPSPAIPASPTANCQISGSRGPVQRLSSPSFRLPASFFFFNAVCFQIFSHPSCCFL